MTTASRAISGHSGKSASRKDVLEVTDVLGCTESVPTQVRVARAYRLTYVIGACKHCNRDCHPGGRREIRPPMMPETAMGQLVDGQTRCSLRSVRLYRCGNRDANSVLCVTTIRMAFWAACNSSSRSATATADARSRLPVGSSQSSNCGSRMSARAMAHVAFRRPIAGQGSVRGDGTIRLAQQFSRRGPRRVRQAPRAWVSAHSQERCIEATARDPEKRTRCAVAKPGGLLLVECCNVRVL